MNFPYLSMTNGNARVWTPDFYIPKIGLYIEVCGSAEFDYEYRKQIYHDNNVPIVFVHFYKEQKWRKFLFMRIKEFEQQRHTEAMKLIERIPADLSGYLECGC